MPETSHIHSLSGVKSPKCLSLEGNKYEIFYTTKENYTILSELSDMINEKQLAMFENCLGVEGLKMCNSLSFTHEETILTKMDLQIVGELNETYEHYIFNLRNQRSEKSIYEYVTELKHLSKKCNYSDCLCDSLLRDKLVMGIVDKETRKSYSK